jgi:hypothetical protein
MVGNNMNGTTLWEKAKEKRKEKGNDHFVGRDKNQSVDMG